MSTTSHDLAHRLESHEAWSAAEHAKVQLTLHPETGAAVLGLDGACAVYAGSPSPLNRVHGLGVGTPVAEDDLEEIERFYGERNSEVRIRVCPLADRTLVEQLAARAYTLGDFMDVYARPIVPDDVRLAGAPGVQIRVATVDEARRWFVADDAGGDWATPDGITFMVIRTVLKPETHLFLAWEGAQPVAGGALEIHDGTAALMAASTLPAFRRRGIHTALLRARLAAAARAGCDLALVHTRPGAASARNVRRAGFELQYTTVEAVRCLGALSQDSVAAASP
jgi:GNAT superfamily N-acetyltransferase